MSQSVLRAAFENHMQFLSTHRGKLRRDDDGLAIASQAEGFSTWTPFEHATAIPPDCPAVRLTPWSGPAWEQRLSDAGFQPAETLSYMQLGDLTRPIPANAAVQATIVASDDEARTFAKVQGEGFELGDSEGDRWWGRFFEEVALRNWSDADQTFHLAHINGEAAGTTLVVRSPGITGIYAVAMRPALHRRGVSATLLERVRRTALERGENAILQANRGSYAEHYYRKLGFETLRELAVWRR